MFKKLIKTDAIDIAGRHYGVRFYETRTLRGTNRYCAEIVLGPADRIILDGNSVDGLESKLSNLIAASVYSRMLVGKNTAAA